MDTTVVDVPEKGRFEVRLDDRVVGLASYHVDGGTMTLPHTEVDPVRGRPGHRDGARRPASWTRPASAACTSFPTALSSATTSSSTPRRSTSSPPRTGPHFGLEAAADPLSPRAAAPTGLPTLRRCLKDTPSTAWRGSSRSCSPAGPVHVTSPQGRFEAGAALLDGRVLDEVFSYGKHLFAGFGGDTLHVHLGLYGSYTSGTGTPPPARGRAADALGGPTGRTATASGPTCAGRPPARC